MSEVERERDEGLSRAGGAIFSVFPSKHGSKEKENRARYRNKREREREREKKDGKRVKERR
eukprot:1377014-Amorphochlora_amoeboformis.AAC.1